MEWCIFLAHLFLFVFSSSPGGAKLESGGGGGGGGGEAGGLWGGGWGGRRKRSIMQAVGKCALRLMTPTDVAGRATM